MQWVGVVPHLLHHLIVDAQGVALMVIGMRLVVKVWDTNIRRRENTAVVTNNCLLSTT
jgi:hypothetical protein